VLAALRGILHKLRQRKAGAPGKAAASAGQSALQQQPEKTEEAEQQQQQQPLMVLEPYDTLMLPTQADAAAARRHWVVAIKAVAAAHTLSAAAGLALRCAPAMLAQLQRPAAMADWLAQPGDHAAEVLVAGGVLLVLLSAADGLASAVVTPRGAASAGQAGSSVRPAVESSSGSGDNAAALLRRVIAVELSAAAAACAAAACLNWALSFVVCLVLVPLAIFCAPASLVSSAAGNAVGSNAAQSGSSSKRSRLVGASLVLLCCSPVSVLLLLAMLSSGGIAAVVQLQWLAGCVVGSSLGSYTAFWAVYLPCWCLTAWSVLVHADC
jgi:hypothetical protein